MSKRYPGGIIRKTPPTPSQTSAQGVWDMASVTQAVKENTWPIAGVPDPISKSLRFRQSASASLTRTVAGVNTTQLTFSFWVKYGVNANDNVIYATSNNSSNYLYIGFNPSFALDVQIGATANRRITTQVFRDPSAWYHIVVTFDTTQATASDRIKIYVNGSQVTAFSTNTTGVSQNANLPSISSTLTNYIGNYNGSAGFYFDGYMTELYAVYGQALTPSSFGNTNDQTGVWQPIAYTGTYGTNGFYLPFSNTASTTTLGYDFSGNSNNWTPNNISLTSGSTYDSMVDVPTQWIPYNTAGDTGALFRGNYCTLNPLDTNSNLALSNGNLTAIPSSTADYWLSRATMQLPSTGKWYWELTLNNTPYLYQAGIYSANRPNSGGTSATGNEYQVSWGTWTTYIQYQSNNAAFAPWGTNTNPTSGDVLMFAVDSDNARMWVGRNGTWYNTSGTANPATNTDPRFSSIPSGLFAGVNLPNPASGGVSMNFGQRPFSYTPPTGFKTLCTTNLSTPTIGATATTQANDYFNAVTYTGTSGTQAVTGVGFQPDWVWIKARNSTLVHVLQDAVRGTTAYLQSNSTTAENTNTANNWFRSFDSDGFTVATLTSPGGVSTNEWNNTGYTYVSWNWNAGGSNATNTAGSITSTVRANTTAGFSVVTYTGTGANATVGHGLGVAPSMVIVKNRGVTDVWCVYHSSLGNTQVIILNRTDATVTATTAWNSTSPTSSVFSIGTLVDVNRSTNNYVAYCFAQVAGYSAFGSYTGNGSSDGPFVYTGFRPRYVLIKASSIAGENWYVVDATRSPYNAAILYLSPNNSGAEASPGTAQFFDFLSNGFKLRVGGSYANSSGETYIYMAFAESPFKFALAR